MGLLSKLGHVALGAMPEDFQNYAGRRLEWYNPVYGTVAEAALEGIASVTYTAFNPDSPFAGVTFVNSLFQVSRVTSVNEDFGNHRWGNGFLEASWQLGKVFFYTTPRRTIKKRIDGKRSDESTDTVYPGGEDY